MRCSIIDNYKKIKQILINHHKPYFFVKVLATYIFVVLLKTTDTRDGIAGFRALFIPRVLLKSRQRGKRKEN